MRLSEISPALDAIAPPPLAGSWDNVGLIAGHGAWGDASTPPRLLLCIDLTEAVAHEALRVHEDAGLDAVVAYHPPVFAPIKRLTGDSREGRTILPLLERRVGVYSPHTALDGVPGGVNDWLLALAAPPETHAPGSVRPIEPARGRVGFKLVTFVPDAHADAVADALAAAGAGVIGNYTRCTFRSPGTGTFRGDDSSNPTVGSRGSYEQAPETRLEMVCPTNRVDEAIHALRSAHPYEEPAFDIFPLEAPARADGAGMGRVCELAEPTPVDAIASRLNTGLGLAPGVLRVATPATNERVTLVAVCPGAGGSLFDKNRVAAPGTLLATGEMRHHDVLGALDRGASVLLAGHTNTERPFLPRYAEMIESRIPGAAVRVSGADRWPFDPPASPA